MAVTSIWPIKGRVDKVINYARNPEKTHDKEKLSELHEIEGVVEYAADEMKTEKRAYVTCLNLHSEETAAQEFMETKRLMQNEGGRSCYHGYQSFKADEVDADTAHSIGVALARELWGDRFQVVIATHCNTGHYHNHFVINSVSDVDGKKFYNSPADYRRMREVSDRLCREAKISVIECPADRRANYGEWLAEKNGKPTMRNRIREDIDRAILASTTEREFQRVMKEMGYEVITKTPKGSPRVHPIVRIVDGGKNFRLDKLGEYYELDSIKQRIQNNYRRKTPFPEVAEDTKAPYYQYKEKAKKATGLYALYLYYCYELHIIVHKPASVKKVSAFLREDVTYRWTDKLGKRNTIYAATLEDLREQEEQILVDQHDGIKANIKNVTVNDVYELWCQLKRGIKDSTMKNYIYMYELFVKPTFGKKKLVQVKKSDVRRFYNQLIDDKVLKPSTVDVIHNIVHQVFQIAVDDDMIRSNPAANMLREIKMAHGSEIEKRKALTLEQEELFLGYLARTSKYQHWYPIFYIMANTGMRVGEITGLRWCDVDMENGIISVNHTLVYYNHRDEKGCYFSINTPKTKAGILEIPMTEGVKQAFLMEKEFQEECGMKSVSHIEGYSDFVFVNRNGEVQHQGTLNKALQRIMRDCNSEVLEKKGVDSDPVLLPKFSCHVLRHTFATRMCESGLNVKVVQSVLGHADVTTTLDIYVTVTNDLKKREITAFETYLKTGAKQMANV